MHATAFLNQPEKHAIPPVVVMHGDEAHLVQSSLREIVQKVLGGDEGGVSRFAGKEADLKTVRDELLTVSMFGDRRLVIVEDADEFITAHRADLEDYCDRPSKKSVLILQVKSWRKNTKLAKKIDASGLELECGELTGARLATWLVEHARDQYGKQLTRDAAALVPELAGTGLSLLDQELAKLASYVGDRDRITVEDVRALVGGWKAETTWNMTDAIRDGRAGQAIQCLDKLLTAGEPAPKILGGINYVFRKFALATELSRRGKPLRGALTEAGVFPRDVDAGEKYLRRIRRARAERILTWLLDADRSLKGGSRLPERLQLEQLVLALSGQLPENAP